MGMDSYRKTVKVHRLSKNGTSQLGWRLAVAGGMAGMVTNTILHPLDTVKTVRQTDPKNFTGVAPTIMAIIRKRGPMALYAGIAPALLGSALSSALYFGFYEFAKQSISNRFPGALERPGSRVPLTAVSAACGNVASSILFVPKEVVKQRMQSGVDSGRFLGAALRLIRANGISGLYSGYKATLLRNIPSTMIRFAMYEELKLLIRKARKRNKGQSLSTPEFITAASIAGIVSSACTTPMDVMKTRYATGKIKPGVSLFPAMKQLVEQEGIPGLFVGIRPRLVWAALFAAIGFTSYEMCKKWALRTPLRMPLANTAQRDATMFNLHSHLTRRTERRNGERSFMVLEELKNR